MMANVKCCIFIVIISFPIHKSAHAFGGLGLALLELARLGSSLIAGGSGGLIRHGLTDSHDVNESQGAGVPLAKRGIEAYKNVEHDSLVSTGAKLGALVTIASIVWLELQTVSLEHRAMTVPVSAAFTGAVSAAFTSSICEYMNKK